ncbi:hypothetical protein P20495_0944 [Pseudoalteromonas sp. BSi20495]|nr:hypothetical protein P20495_0944 [Pseudoalteromonas sp. BSi20495]
MADNFRVIFAGLADGIDSNAASINLADKLKTSEEKVALFLKESHCLHRAIKTKH